MVFLFFDFKIRGLIASTDRLGSIYSQRWHELLPW